MASLTKQTSKLPSSDLLEKAEHIVQRMDQNAAFPNPTPALATVTTAIEALRIAVVDALDGGRTATAIRRTRHEELRSLVNNLGDYVSNVAAGNELAILSTGFTVRRKPDPAPEPGMPQDVKVSMSDHVGRADLSWMPEAPAVTYHVQWNGTDMNDEKSWQLVAVSTRSSAKVTGLPSAQLSHFRVAAIGTRGMGPWSQVVSTLVR